MQHSKIWYQCVTILANGRTPQNSLSGSRGSMRPRRLGTCNQPLYFFPLLDFAVLKLPKSVSSSRLLPFTGNIVLIRCRWRNFQKFGKIVYIEIFEGRDGHREGSAKLKFSPPPNEEFWGSQREPRRHAVEAADSSLHYNVFVLLWENRNPRSFRVQSPIKPQIFYDPQMRLWPSSLHIGIMVDPDSMMPLQSIEPSKPADLKFTVDLVRKKITAEFKVTFQDPRSRGVAGFVIDSAVGEFNRENSYMFQIPFDQLKTISQINFNQQRFGLAMSLDSPPQYHRKREDEQASHSDESLRWSDWDTWYRQTDIVYDPYRLQKTVIALHKERPVIDIGICSLPLLYHLLTSQVVGLRIFSSSEQPRTQLPSSMR
jgi:hypothetical protein